MSTLHLILACGLGALIRYALSPLNRRTSLPLGTLLGNLLVAFLAGYVSQQAPAPVWGHLATLLGGLGTYSAFNREVLGYWQQRRQVFLYVLLTYGLGAIMVYLGLLLGAL